MNPEEVKSPLPPRKVLFETEEVTKPEVVMKKEEKVEEEVESKKLPLAKNFDKKWILLGIVVVILVGCGIWLFGNMGGKKTDQEVVINYWGLWEEESVMAGIIADFETKNPKIKVKYIKNQKDNYRTRLKAKLAKTGSDSESPDVFRIHNSWLPMFREDLAKVPIETVKNIGLESDFWETYKTDLKEKGSYWAVPMMYDGLSLYYNPEILGEKGVKAPKTWWGLQEAAVKLTEKNELGQTIRAGLAIGLTENVDHWSDIIGLMLKQNGVSMLADDPINQKKFKDVLAYYVLLASEYQVWDASLPPSTMAFAGGNLAFYFGPSWRMFDFDVISPELKYEVTTVPQLATLENAEMDKIEREGLTDYLTNIHLSTYWVEGVNNRSKKQEEVWKFVEFLVSKESLERMYTAAGQLRSFGEIYPRKSLGEKLKSDSRLKPFVEAADFAGGSYLASRTFDDGGLNDLLIGYFNDAINGMLSKNEEELVIMGTLKKGIEQVATKYNLVNSN